MSFPLIRLEYCVFLKSKSKRMISKLYIPEETNINFKDCFHIKSEYSENQELLIYKKHNRNYSVIFIAT